MSGDEKDFPSSSSVGSSLAPPPSSSLSNDSENATTIPYESSGVKLNWLYVFIVSFVITIVITALTFFVVWLVGMNYPLIWAFLDWIFFLECGFFFTFGGCLGSWKQSFSLNVINRRLFKGEKLTGADTKLAIGSSYSYVLTGVFLGLLSLIFFLVL